MVVGEGSFCYCLNRNKIVLEKWLPKNNDHWCSRELPYYFFKACFLHLLRNWSVHRYCPPLITGTTVFGRCLSVACFPSELCHQVKVGVATQVSATSAFQSLWPAWHFSHDSPHRQPPLPNQPLPRQAFSCSELNRGLHWGLIFIIL